MNDKLRKLHLQPALEAAPVGCVVNRERILAWRKGAYESATKLETVQGGMARSEDAEPASIHSEVFLIRR